MRRMPTTEQLKAVDEIKEKVEVGEDGNIRILDLANKITLGSEKFPYSYFEFSAADNSVKLELYNEIDLFANITLSNQLLFDFNGDSSIKVTSNLISLNTAHDYFISITNTAITFGNTDDFSPVVFDKNGIHLYDDFGSRMGIDFSVHYVQSQRWSYYFICIPQDYDEDTLGIILNAYSEEGGMTKNYLNIGIHYDEQGGGFYGDSIAIRPKRDSIMLTCAPSGTATLKIHRTSGEYFTAENEIIPDRIGLHMDITNALGTQTSQQITLTEEDGIDLSGLNATGVLLNGTSLVGCCHLVGTSQNQAVLYFQNALGTDLQAGIYIANLTSVLDN